MTLPTQDVSSRFFLAIGRLSRNLRRVAGEGPSQSEISALTTLAIHGAQRLGDLAAMEGVAAPTISRIVSLLIAAGYARRRQDPADHRVWIATATAKGIRLVSDDSLSCGRELRERMALLPLDQQELIEAALPALEALVAAGR